MNETPVDPTNAAPNGQTPGQFDLASLLTVVAVFALLFSMLRCLGLPPLAYLAAGTFCAAVGLGQAMFYDGKNRLYPGASVGALFAYAGQIVYFVCEPSVAPRGLIGLCAMLTPLAAILGFLVGTFVAVVFCGVFALLDAFRRISSRSRSANDDPTESVFRSPVPRPIGLALLGLLFVLFCAAIVINMR